MRQDILKVGDVTPSYLVPVNTTYCDDVCSDANVKFSLKSEFRYMHLLERIYLRNKTYGLLILKKL